MDVRFPGPAGALVGLLEEPEEAGEPRGTAVVCHPHPQHGGTMRNTVVFRTARALRAAGLVTLRFDFRGAGESEGAHDGRGGEEDDAAAAFDLLAERYPGLPAWGAGFSFGARTLCGLAVRDTRILRLVLVAPPVNVYDCGCLEAVERPGLLLLGSEDRFGTLADLSREHPGVVEPGGPLDVEEIDGADHMFRGRTPVLEERIRYWARAALEDDA